MMVNWSLHEDNKDIRCFGAAGTAVHASRHSTCPKVMKTRRRNPAEHTNGTERWNLANWIVYFAAVSRYYNAVPGPTQQPD